MEIRKVRFDDVESFDESSVTRPKRRKTSNVLESYIPFNLC